MEEKLLLEDEVDMLIFADCFEGSNPRLGKRKKSGLCPFSRDILISSRSMRIS